jgi:cob(I)alamin adenosyltransferase
VTHSYTVTVAGEDFAVHLTPRGRAGGFDVAVPRLGRDTLASGDDRAAALDAARDAIAARRQERQCAKLPWEL